MDNSKRLTEALQFAESFAVSSRVEFLTPELLLVGICCRNNEFMALCESYHVDYQKNLKEPIYGDLHNNFVPDTVGEYEILPSVSASYGLISSNSFVVIIIIHYQLIKLVLYNICQHISHVQSCSTYLLGNETGGRHTRGGVHLQHRDLSLLRDDVVDADDAIAVEDVVDV